MNLYGDCALLFFDFSKSFMLNKNERMAQDLWVIGKSQIYYDKNPKDVNMTSLMLKNEFLHNKLKWKKCTCI